MPNAFAPDTPPSTAPTSPVSPCTVSSADNSVITIDPKKSISDGEYTEFNEKIIPKADTTGPKDESFRGKISNCFQKLALPIHSPHIRCPHRKVDGRPKLVQRIDDHPQGYPQLAAFVNSDENFLIARKYGFLRSRVLLYRQDELSVLEKQLVALDDDDKENRSLALQSRKYDEETDKDPIWSRKVLMKNIDDKLKEYGKHPPNPFAFEKEGQYSEHPAFLRLFQTSYFVHWVGDHMPLTKEESTFLEHQDDLVALSDGQECGWLDGKFFTSKEQTKKTDDDHLHLCSKRRIDILVRLVLVLTTVGLLVGPSAILFLVPGHSTLKICLICVFTLLFSATLSLCTRAKRQEMLAASAT
ncbi:hypothetical protein MMC28_003886 [Mycoblastus sanguinarius]|nr:hypothetical protein [Mycoblastus sanguinarius]